jgi:hypothetical protein
MPNTNHGGQVISTILRHDAKTTSYKLALIRAINDVAISYPDIGHSGSSVAVPLTLLAERWIGYYWPFVDPNKPILQGSPARTTHGQNQDIGFRAALTALRICWEKFSGGNTKPSDGFLAANELRRTENTEQFPADLITRFNDAKTSIISALVDPIRYAGPGDWSVFQRPTTINNLAGLQRNEVETIPGVGVRDRCLIVNTELWQTFRSLSLWIEALCIHEWCLFIEKRQRNSGTLDPIRRGDVYELLTDQPSNRRPLTWERNLIDLLIAEGHVFTCPWTQKRITSRSRYDVDHVMPLSVYPTNELWNLVPSDPEFNQQSKRDRLPSLARLKQAQPHLARTYWCYLQSSPLARVLTKDVEMRFGSINSKITNYESEVTAAVVRFVELVGDARNLSRF